jgi:hypothetical protein
LQPKAKDYYTLFHLEEEGHLQSQLCCPTLEDPTIVGLTMGRMDAEAIPIVRELKVRLEIFNSVNRALVQTAQVADNEQKETHTLLY